MLLHRVVGVAGAALLSIFTVAAVECLAADKETPSKEGVKAKSEMVEGLAKKLGLIPEFGSGGKWNLLWVVDPPLFEYDDESKTWAAAHHAFTRPHDEDLPFLGTDPGRVKCYRYDVVSKAGAVGLMQLLPRTAEEVATRYGIRDYRSAADLTNPVVNLELGAAYLAYLRTRFGHSVHYLAAYNMGPSAMRTRIKNGNYELGALTGYVKKIHGRTLELRRSATQKSKRILERRYRKELELQRSLAANAT